MAFNQSKTAQIAAWFLDQAGGSMEILKLMKLLYLAERETLGAFARPLTGDRMVSMPHGPVLSQTYEVVGGQAASEAGGWDAWISDRAGRIVALQDQCEVTRDAMDLVSDAELGILETVWGKFGHMGAWELRDYTHDSCSEWKDPNGSSSPITYESVFRALGKSKVAAAELAQLIRDDETVDRVFAEI
jgi:uncharacterized phage-associated protein